MRTSDKGSRSARGVDCLQLFYVHGYLAVTDKRKSPAEQFRPFLFLNFMKQFYSKSLLLLIISLMMTLTASAYDCVVDGIYYNLYKSGRTASVTYLYLSSSAYQGTVVIPPSFEYEGATYSVTSIGYDAFCDCI